MEQVKFAFEDLKVYEKALDFVDMSYLISSTFPKEEKYGLSSQFTRAATSIALNIAINSVKECVVCSTIARRQNFISIEEDNENRLKLEELSKMITGLQKYLKNKTKD